MSSRARGLWWKEWRQLRLLRLGGALMIVVIPVILLSAAEASKRGWLPLGAIRNYSAATVVQDALPMVLGFLVWPLLALMFVAQSFCGDVASGTEWFWMERPVKPRRVWTARLLASLLSLTGVMALHWVVWRLLVAAWGNPHTFDAVGHHMRWFLMNQFYATTSGAAMLAGLLIAVAAFLSALAASSFARTPMQVLPLGLILAALPPGLGALAAALFPHARVGSSNMAAVVPLLLFVVYAFASYRTSCRGEPAGRGKLVRGLSVLGVGVLAVVALALPTGFWVTQRAEATALRYSIVVASPTGDRLFVYNQRQGSGWLVDVESGAELLHLLPYVVDAAWDAEGERLAVVQIGGPSGIGATIYDRNGTLLVENLDCERCRDITWSGGRLAVSTYRNRAWELDWIDPATGERTAMEIEPGMIPLKLIGPTQDGASYVVRQVSATDDTALLLLHALDATTNRIGEPVSVERTDGYYYRIGDLAPDGSAMLIERVRESAVVDLSTGRARRVGFEPVWLQPSRPVWAERVGADLALLIDEEGAIRGLGHFKGHGAYELLGSPDGRRLLLVRSPNVSSPGGVKALQHWLYDAETERWSELEQTKVNDRDGWPARPEWVNNDAIVLRGVGVLALCEPAVPGSLRYVKR